jgi:hypothetical protein
MLIITMIVIYNRGDDHHKINFSLEFIMIAKPIMHFNG